MMHVNNALKNLMGAGSISNKMGRPYQFLLVSILTIVLSLMTSHSYGALTEDMSSSSASSTATSSAEESRSSHLRKPGTTFSSTPLPQGDDVHHNPVLEWTWMYGSKLCNLSSWLEYNVSRVPNNPGARGGSAFWVDGYHVLWVFGGFGFGGDQTARKPQLLSDLWVYDTPNDTWKIQQQLTTDGVSRPAPRRLAVACGVPEIMFMMFGGQGKDQSALNDTWIYMLRNSTWLSLDDRLHKIPTARFDTVSWCLSDRLIIFGGMGLDNVIQSDVWQFTFHTLEWEKIEMSLEHFTDDGHHHLFPAPRNGAASWVGHNQTMYLFGGNIKSGVSLEQQNSMGFVSDLWQLSFKGKEFTWTYIKGYTKTPCGHMGIYGKFGHGGMSTMPGCRIGATTWVDGDGNLYMLGGKGVDSVAYANTKHRDKILADVWIFNMAKQKWIWVGGSTHGNVKPRHGMLGLYNAENSPGSRFRAVAWCSVSDNTYYLFGGMRLAKRNLGYMDDLWKLSIGFRESSDLVFLLPFSSGVLFLICFSGVMTVAILFGLGVFLKKCIDLPRHSPSRSPDRDYHIKYSPLSNDNSLELT